MDKEEVEIDGCEAYNPSVPADLPMPALSKQHSLHKSRYNSKTYDEEKLDSVGSAGYFSLDSDRYDSDRLPSETNEGRLQNNEELIPVSFKRLSISQEPNRFGSIEDEGFYSEDAKPLDLSTSKRSVVQKIKEEPEPGEEDPVTVDVYVQHVSDTFQQDEDGDT